MRGGRYLITGGAGFIGSHLAEALIERGHQVTALDNLSTGDEGNLRGADEVRLRRGSVTDSELVDDLVGQADVVLHLAAAVGVQLILQRPLESLFTNIKGTETVLDAAHRHGKKVLIASTSEIYGKSRDTPFMEEGDRLLGSTKTFRWSYSTSKAVDEVLAFGYHREHGLETIVVRLFNTVGPRQTGAYGMVLPRFVDSALHHAPLTVYGTGDQSRCFCDVRDVVDAILGLANEPRAVGDVFNVGSTEEITILELAKRVIEATDSSSEIRFLPYEQAYEPGFEEMPRRVPETSKIGALIGWAATRTLDEIIEELIAQYSAKGAEVEAAPRGRLP